ncbi:MAG: hypothetical protein ACLFV7_04105 [Phycisphaerae bacterium]
MSEQISERLMSEFAADTGLTGDAPPRRYLWTDAFAVCNFLGLHDQTGKEEHLQLALELTEQVHSVLGRHRDDDERSGWISGLDDDEARHRPTAGGLRIGKTLPERKPGTPLNPREEWDRDGQYFHYLTKWMHALNRTAERTGRSHFHRWACELAAAACRAFVIENPAGQRSMVWKMSIDLTRPLVPSMGQHDPLDGLITCLELQAASVADPQSADLAGAVGDFEAIVEGCTFATDDPLGIGGLLTDVARLIHLGTEAPPAHPMLLETLLDESLMSLEHYARVYRPGDSPQYRLAFRELGLSIGLHAIERARAAVNGQIDQEEPLEAILEYRPLAEQIEQFWSTPASRSVQTWTRHQDINAVMLATSLAPAGYVEV